MTSGAEIKSDVIEKKLIYAGDGCIVVPAGSKEKDDKYAYRIYDLKSDLEDPEYVCSGFQVVEGDVSKSLVNDLTENLVMVDREAKKVRNKELYRIQPDGTIRQSLIMTKEISSSLSDNFGSIFLEDGTVLSLVRTSKKSMLIDANGPIKEYDFKIVAGFPMDEGWMFAAENTEGTHYYGSLDLQGEFTMEPMKTEAVCLVFEDGRILEYNHKAGQEKGLKVILDLSGDVLFEGTDEQKTLEIQNGIVYEHTKREGIYTLLE